MFDNRNLLIELKWQREYFKRGYVSNQEELFNLWIFDECIKALEQEPCEDEYIKVPKKALKYRTAGMVAYNAEWLKNHFDIERVVICGVKEPCKDAISRAELLKAINTWDKFGCDADTKLVLYKDHYIPYIHYDDVVKCIKGMPSVNPQEPKTDVLDKIRVEIDKQAKWLLQAGYTTYNVDIALDAIKAIVAESEEV